MSPRAQAKPPVASRRKRFIHALYLAQPFLQFVALMAVLFVLGRCSPLAPSSDRTVLQTASAGAMGTHSPLSDSAAEEQDIKREMRDISSSVELPLISQSDLRNKLLPNSILAGKAMDLPTMQNLFALRERQTGTQRDERLLVLPLSADQKDAFFRSGTVRVNLVDALSASMAPNVRQAYFTEIQKLIPRSDLSAKAYLELSDEDLSAPDAVNELPISSKIQLAIFSDDQKAWLQITRQDQNLDDQQQKLIESAKNRTLSMILVLE